MNTGQAGGQQRRAEDWMQATSSAGTRPTAGRKLGQLLNLIHFDLIQPKKKKRRENWRTPGSEALACLPSMWGCMSRAPRGAGAMPPGVREPCSQTPTRSRVRRRHSGGPGAAGRRWRGRVRADGVRDGPGWTKRCRSKAKSRASGPGCHPPHVTIRGQLQIFPNVP